MNNEKATEFETKSLLYLLSMCEDSDEIYNYHHLWKIDGNMLGILY